jgi:hypothetical protein
MTAAAVNMVSLDFIRVFLPLLTCLFPTGADVALLIACPRNPVLAGRFTDLPRHWDRPILGPR